MMRRGFIAGLFSVAAVAPVAAQAQPSGKVHRLTIVGPSSAVVNTMKERWPEAFSELRRLGFIDGRNLDVEWDSGEDRSEDFSALAQRVVRREPEVICTVTMRVTLAFKDATDTIPIVALVTDPVAYGLVSSLARPGGNITAVSADAGLEIWGKRIQLLKEAIPQASKIALLASQSAWAFPSTNALRQAAQDTGLSLIGPPLAPPLSDAEYRRVFSAMVQEGADAMIVGDQPEHLVHRRLIVDLAQSTGLPILSAWREHAELGGLMAYSMDRVEMYRQLAGIIARVLSGTKPSDIPVYQATKFELIINLKAAKALGLRIPPTLLTVADEVIE